MRTPEITFRQGEKSGKWMALWRYDAYAVWLALNSDGVWYVEKLNEPAFEGGLNIGRKASQDVNEKWKTYDADLARMIVT